MNNIKFLIALLFSIFITMDVNALGGQNTRVRYAEHLEIKRLSNNQENAFDSIEITAYLTLIDPIFYTNVPDTIHYFASINGKQLVFSNTHKVIITESGNINISYLDGFYQDGANYYYNYYNKELCFFKSNLNSNVLSNNVYYLNPDYKLVTNYSWNQIRVFLKYDELDPMPQGNYCFVNDLQQGVNDNSNYHIDRINWYNNGDLLSEKDSIFTITESGVYYAEIISNFGYKYYSDTITISDYQFAKYSDCLDAQIAVNFESKPIGKKGFKDVIDEKLKIFPNPVIDQIELNFKTCKSVNASFELYTLSGERLFTKTFHFLQDENSKVLLDFNDISPGLYFLCFELNGLKKMTKIIKQ